MSCEKLGCGEEVIGGGEDTGDGEVIGDGEVGGSGVPISCNYYKMWTS